MTAARFMKMAILSLIVLPVLAIAGEKFKPETALTVDASGNAILAHPWRDFGSKVGIGGNLGFEIRPISLFSIGVEAAGRDYCDNHSWHVFTADVTGKLFPLGRTAKGEAYIEAGVGLIVPHNNDVDSNGKSAHVIGALGYRFFCPSSQSRFFDLSAVYDGYSPRKEPLSTLGVRVGLGWLFGSNRQAAHAGKPTVQATPEPPKVSTKEAVKAVAPAASKAVSAANAKLDKQAEEMGKVADVKRSSEGIEVNMKSDILFAPGKAELKPEAVEQINKVGDILAKYPNEKIEIIGYADSKGTDAVNKTVSEKRANAVKDALLARKVPAGSLTAVGKGSADPIGDNKTAEGRAKNRRVELKITSQK